LIGELVRSGRRYCIVKEIGTHRKLARLYPYEEKLFNTDDPTVYCWGWWENSILEAIESYEKNKGTKMYKLMITGNFPDSCELVPNDIYDDF